MRSSWIRPWPPWVAVAAAFGSGCGDGGRLVHATRPTTEPGAPAAGEPAGFRVFPEALDFGWVSPGRGRTRRVHVLGTAGPAPRVDAWIDGADADAFALDDLVVPGADEASTRALGIRASPREARVHAAHLRLEGAGGERVEVPLRADGRGPPRVHATPGALELGPAADATRLTLRNGGESRLTVRIVPPVWPGPAITAPDIAPLAPGAVRAVTVRAGREPPGPWSGTMRLATNDPDRPELALPIAVERRPEGPGGFVVDAVADDRSDPFFLDPWRVELSVRGPGGLVVGPHAPAQSGSAGAAVRWSASGPLDRGARIVGEPDVPAGPYAFEVRYVDDCRRAPTGLVAAALGLATQALLAALGGGAPTPVGAVWEAALADACVDRGPLDLALRIRIGGRDVAAPATTLGATGDRWAAGRLVRDDPAGRFRWVGSR